MRAAIVTFPGSNCDYDCYKAFTETLGEEAFFVWHRETDLQDPDIVVLPGGFSYGDYLRAGAIARFSPVMESVQRFAAEGKPVLGICNGFQILCEAHMLPGALVKNRSLKYESRPVDLRVETADTMFTNGMEEGQVLRRIPIAHGMGRFVADPEVVDRLEAERRVVFRYVDPNGEWDLEVNGAVNGIAGIVSAEGNVLGLMPHPERALDQLLGSADGLGIFASLQGALR